MSASRGEQIKDLAKIGVNLAYNLFPAASCSNHQAVVFFSPRQNSRFWGRYTLSLLKHPFLANVNLKSAAVEVKPKRNHPRNFVALLLWLSSSNEKFSYLR